MDTMSNSMGFFLEDDSRKIELYLKEREIISPDLMVQHIEKPGEGNMNKVARVMLSDLSSIILKQARGWVEKYPQIEAPRERIVVEYTFYSTVAEYPRISRRSPKVLYFDPANYLMVLEDLGKAKDFSFVYQRNRSFTASDIQTAASYLNGIKQISILSYPQNLALRKLNHQHIFHLPFIEENNFDLDQIQPGLQELSKICKQDQSLKSCIAELGELYLSSGKVLVHGDFYPGSLLKTAEGLKVIDPEFSFLGPEEWDPAVFTAHLLLSGSQHDTAMTIYQKLQRTPDFNQGLFAGFTGVEVLRRLIGLAQLPLNLSLDGKARLLEEAITWVKQQKIPTLSPI